MYDAIVVGAGPGGATAAALMARDGLRVLLLDKASFPRDKICGDAVSGKSVDVLRRLGLLDRMMEAEQVGSWGVTFGGPYGDEVAIPFTKELDRPVPPGFISRREVFDQVLFEEAVRSGAEVWENAEVEDLVWQGERVAGVKVKHYAATGTVKAHLQARVVIGADGAYSVVARALGMDQLDPRHYCAGLRVYYEGVTGFHDLNHVELHFLEEAIPGYFWVFPLPNGQANVGIGMLSSVLKRRDVKLKPLLQQCIAHPRFAERFAGARPLGPVKGWGLPLGSRPRPMAGDGWMLVGDAASLIDPFTGEGIGNAMISGERAARWAAQAAETGDASAAALAGYEAAVMRYLHTELRLSHTMQRMLNWKWLLNTVIRKASRSPEVADAISSMFDDEAQRRKLVSPGFYFRLLRA